MEVRRVCGFLSRMSRGGRIGDGGREEGREDAVVDLEGGKEEGVGEDARNETQVIDIEEKRGRGSKW